MKSLIDLKSELVNNEVNHIYVFTGEEFKIRSIYVEKICEIVGKYQFMDSMESLYKELSKKPLFRIKTAYICYGDNDYLKQSDKVYEKLISKVKDNVVVLVFETIEERSKFFKFFDEYITIFNRVSDDIAVKYVNKQCHVPLKIAQEIAFNCNNSYNNIINEMDKYQYVEQEKDHTIDALTYAYQMGIMNKRDEVPSPKEFADAFIQRDRHSLGRYVSILEDKETDMLYYLSELYQTFQIALFIKRYGKWNGGTEAYNAGLYWGRVKEVREFNILYNQNDILDILKCIKQLDDDIRIGRIANNLALSWLIGVIL